MSDVVGPDPLSKLEGLTRRLQEAKEGESLDGKLVKAGFESACNERELLYSRSKSKQTRKRRQPRRLQPGDSVEVDDEADGGINFFSPLTRVGEPDRALSRARQVYMRDLVQASLEVIYILYSP